MSDELLESARIIKIFGEIDDDTADAFSDAVLSLSFEHPEKEITVYINSEGGSMYAMFAMHDVMRMVPNPIHTIGIGRVMSAAVLLMAAGDRRSIMPNTYVMMHEPSMFGGFENKVGQWERDLNHIKVMKKRKYELMSKYTGADLKKIAKDLNDQDKYLDAEESVQYGLVDEICKIYDGEKPTD